LPIRPTEDRGTAEKWLVSGIDVLLGMNLARECLTIIDGPGGYFTIGF
jgi:hypothetical protein